MALRMNCFHGGCVFFGFVFLLRFGYSLFSFVNMAFRLPNRNQEEHQ